MAKSPVPIFERIFRQASSDNSVQENRSSTKISWNVDLIYKNVSG